MNVINFPGGTEPHVDPDAVERAVKLKQRLVRFVTQGPMREAHDALMHESGVDPSNLYEFIDFTDWFIFEWEDEDGTRVIDELLAAETDLSNEDRRLAEAWTEAIDDLFEVAGRRESGFLLTDGEGERYFAVSTSASASELGLEPGMMVETRLLPVGDIHLLSGAQTVYNSREEAEASMREELDEEVEQWLYDAFVAHFGADEATMTAAEVPARLQAFCRFAVEEFTPEGMDVTLGEIAGQEGVSFDAFLEELPGVEGEAAGITVGVLADPDEGLAIVPAYDMLRGYLAGGEGDPEALAELLMFHVESAEIPPFVIRKLAGLDPERFSGLMRVALGEPGFDARTGLEGLLEDFKPGAGDDEPDDFEDLFEDELVYAEQIPDVRELAAADRPEGSIAAAARGFLEEAARKLKPETLEQQALAASMLVFYAHENECYGVEELDEGLLLDFLAVWYPGVWADRSAAGAKQLLTVTGKLTAWIDRAHGTDLGKRFKANVLPGLKEDLPRVVRAAVALERELPGTLLMDALERITASAPGSFGEALGALLDPDELGDTVEGSFAIVTIDGRTAMARERVDAGGRDGGDEEIYKIELPPKAAGLLRPGDTLAGSIQPDGKRWRVRSLTAIYPPSAGA